MAGLIFRAVRCSPLPSASAAITTGYGVGGGRTYLNPGHSGIPDTAGTLDASVNDAQVLGGNGYLLEGLVGTTANRPAPTDGDWPTIMMGPHGLLRYFDTTLGAWLHYDATSATGWRNSTTHQAV